MKINPNTKGKKAYKVKGYCRAKLTMCDKCGQSLPPDWVLRDAHKAICSGEKVKAFPLQADAPNAGLDERLFWAGFTASFASSL